MYKEFYNFKEIPFTPSPNPKFLFCTRTHKLVLDAIKSTIIERNGNMVITGEAGVGKTLLIRSVLKDLSEQIKTAFIFQPILSLQDLLKEILLDLDVPISEDIENASPYMIQFTNYIQNLHSDDSVLIFIDEAQAMEEDVLKELFQLAFPDNRANEILQIFLVGQPELETKLKSTNLIEVKKKISHWCRINHLSKDESEQYIRHHLYLVHSDISKVFTSEAIFLIRKNAKGIPRVINLICDNALWLGFQRARDKVDSQIVKESLKHIHIYVRPRDFTSIKEAFSFRKIHDLSIEPIKRTKAKVKGLFPLRAHLLIKVPIHNALESLDKRKLFLGINDSIKHCFRLIKVLKENSFFREDFSLMSITDLAKEAGIYVQSQKAFIKEFFLWKMFSRISKLLNEIFTLRHPFLILSSKFSFKRLLHPKFLSPALAIILLSGLYLGNPHTFKYFLNTTELTRFAKNRIAQENPASHGHDQSKVSPKSSVLVNLKDTKIHSLDNPNVAIKAELSPRKRNEKLGENQKNQSLKTAKFLQQQPSVAKFVVSERRRDTGRSKDTLESYHEERNIISVQDVNFPTKKESINQDIKKIDFGLPIIMKSFASKKINAGDIWKIYLKAADPNGKMESIFGIVGKGDSYRTIIKIKKENREKFSGYIYLNTRNAFKSDIDELSVNISIRDASGNFSEPLVFGLSFQSNVIVEGPPKGIFEEQDLGPIMIPQWKFSGMNLG